MLYQDGREIGRKEGVPTFARGDFWEHDLSPPGSHGFQPGVSYTVVCEFDSPDGLRWRSTRVSGVGNQGSRLDFELGTVLPTLWTSLSTISGV